ncbi:MAG: sn-glycerol-3-phosphate import ATP-binding protein UgpC [Proteobacteria bacterium]|nr:sn-glycerol-3-phosphate import ATP-binding protein UgpC [Pseudomonadota bacterium]
MASVTLQQLSKRFGEFIAVHAVTCEIADGEFVVILGPSGCGKSTLLRLIAGLEDASDGKLLIGGREVTHVEPKDRNIAMVFQNYALYPHMSVYDNMAYGLRIRGMSKAEIEARVQKAAAILQLGSFLQRKPRQLSGGQRQRVAMGRAIVREPEVFLFDEPLSNLDAKLRVQMRVEIKKLHDTIKTTGIYVTHDQVEAMTLANRLIVMNHGKVEQIGSPIEVYTNPASAFVAGFIGSPAMNFLPASAGADGRSLAVGGLKLPLSAGTIDASRPVTFGIRPEHLAPGPGPWGELPLVVELVELLGADTLVHCRLEGGNDTLVVRLPGTVVPKVGERLGVHPVPGSFHVFDGETGRRIAVS